MHQDSPQATRTGGGETPSPRPRIDARSYYQHHHYHHFQSTVSVQKLRRFNSLIFVLRFGAFCFSMAASVFMLVNPIEPNSPRWYHFDAFRFVLAGNTLVAVYSLFQMGASFWEMSRGVTLLPEFLQVWFDFGHDQVFAYVLLSVETVGTSLARTLKITDTCMPDDTFCIQADISIVLGFIAFLFLALSSLLSGFRVVCFIINGSRVHL